MTEKQKELIELKEKLKQGGGEKAIEKQHSLGKLTARERVEKLFLTFCNRVQFVVIFYYILNHLHIYNYIAGICKKQTVFKKI